MKKIIFILIVLVCIFLCLLLLKRNFVENLEVNSNVEDKNVVTDNESEENKDTIIKERGEMSTSGLYSLDGVSSSAEIDLQMTDMTWNNNCALYHKIITNEADYTKFSERIELPEVDFTKNFLVVVSDENLKPANEVDLVIYDVTADENTTHIIMKQRENPVIYTDIPSNPKTARSYYSDNNVFWAVVDNSVLKENADVVIEHDE